MILVNLVVVLFDPQVFDFWGIWDEYWQQILCVTADWLSDRCWYVEASEVSSLQSGWRLATASGEVSSAGAASSESLPGRSQMKPSKVKGGYHEWI